MRRRWVSEAGAALGLGPPPPEERDRAAGHDRRSAVPALFGGLAESAVLFLLVWDVATNEGGVVSGPLAHYPLFVAVFALGVAVATRYRAAPVLPVAIAGVALGLGVAQGTAWGSGTEVGVGITVVLWLLVGLRVFSLALRDWRHPVGVSFAAGAGLLLGEIFLMGGFPTPRAVLSLAVPQFFFAALASRAASIRLATDPVRTGHGERGPDGTVPRAVTAGRLRVVLAALAAFAAVLAVAVGIGGPGGGLQVLGRVLLDGTLIVLGVILAPVIGSFLVGVVWVFERFHISLSPLRSLATTLGGFRTRPVTGGGSSPVLRVVGLVLLAGLAFVLVRTIRSKWRWFERAPLADPGEVDVAGAGPFRAHRRRRGPRLRRELPADTVRRWYAEALLMLERKGLPKPSSGTPGEYLRQVTRAFPDSASGFTALTRAYEDVRYGSIRFDRGRLLVLEVNRELAMDVLRRSRRLDDDPDPS